MKSTAIELFQQRNATTADLIARKALDIQGNVPPDADTVVAEVVTNAMAGDLRCVPPLLDQLSGINAQGSGLARAIDLGVAQFGQQADPQKLANLEAAKVAFEANGAQLLSNLMQAIRDIQT